MALPRVQLTVTATNYRGDDAHAAALLDKTTLPLTEDLASMGLQVPADADVTDIPVSGTIRRVILAHVTADAFALFPVADALLASFKPGGIAEMVRLRIPAVVATAEVIWEPAV